MQRNSSYVIVVAVDLDKKKYCIARARTNQTENGIASPGKRHRSLKKLHIQYFVVLNFT